MTATGNSKDNTHTHYFLNDDIAANELIKYAMIGRCLKKKRGLTGGFLVQVVCVVASSPTMARSETRVTCFGWGCRTDDVCAHRGDYTSMDLLFLFSAAA